MILIKYQRERQLTYNVTSRRVRATIVAVEKQWVLHNLSACICSLRYPACNAHEPFCHLWPAPLCNIFPRYLINGTIFGGRGGGGGGITDSKMCVLIFSTTFVRHISHSKMKWARYNKNVYWSSCKVQYPYSCPILMKLGQIFEKTSNAKFHKIPSSGSRAVPRGRTDRHDKASSRFSQFCERALTGLNSVETALSVQFPAKHYATRA